MYLTTNAEQTQGSTEKIVSKNARNKNIIQTKIRPHRLTIVQQKYADQCLKSVWTSKLFYHGHECQQK